MPPVRSTTPPVVVLLSGGVDSSVLTKHCVNQGNKVIGLTILCKKNGGNHDEAAAAEVVAGLFKIDHRTVDLSGLGSIFRHNNTVMSVGGSINNCHHPTPPDPDSLICRRGLSLGVEMMHMVSCVAALELGAERVLWAIHADDIPVVEDRRKMREYLDLMEKVVFQRSGRSVCIETPFINMTKADVVDLGRQIGVPLDVTISCVQPVEGRPCRVCKQCLLREDAMTTVVRA